MVPKSEILVKHYVLKLKINSGEGFAELSDIVWQ